MPHGHQLAGVPPPSFPSKCQQQQQPGCLQGTGHKAEWPDHRLLGQQQSSRSKGWPLTSRVEASRALHCRVKASSPVLPAAFLSIVSLAPGPGAAATWPPHHPQPFSTHFIPSTHSAPNHLFPPWLSSKTSPSSRPPSPL